MKEMFENFSVLTSEIERRNWEEVFHECGYEKHQYIWSNKPDKLNERNTQFVIWDLDAIPFCLEFKIQLSSSKIFLCSKNKENAYIAFQYHLEGFWLKPINPKQVINSLSKAWNSNKNLQHETLSIFKAMYSDFSRRLLIHSHVGFDIVEHRNIVRAVAERSYSRIFFINGEIKLISKSLSELEKDLNSELFFRSHISHLINLSTLKKYSKQEGGHLVLIDGAVVPLAHRRKEELFIAIHKLDKEN
ncbi:MAG: LytTR family transcriptional regulator DNA-binding domain-containing protein [Saprospiraceae bacterium]